MARFPYTVEIQYSKLNDNRCCALVHDFTGYNFSRCDKKAKISIDGVGLCGNHARAVNKWRAKL